MNDKAILQNETMDVSNNNFVDRYKAIPDSLTRGSEPEHCLAQTNKNTLSFNFQFSLQMNLPKIPVPPSMSNGRVFLESLLNKNVKIEITDGRTLIGQYLCTDREKNIVLGGCQEFVTDPCKFHLTKVSNYFVQKM